MIEKIDKNAVRQKRHKRIRAKLSGTAETPRLCVYRSLNEVYAQIIDDSQGHTLCACSSLDKSMAAVLKGKNKVQQAEAVGKEIAARAKAKKIESVVFDRGGYLYTGRIKSLADGAREAGLKF